MTSTGVHADNMGPWPQNIFQGSVAAMKRVVDGLKILNKKVTQAATQNHPMRKNFFDITQNHNLCTCVCCWKGWLPVVGRLPTGENKCVCVWGRDCGGRLKGELMLWNILSFFPWRTHRYNLKIKTLLNKKNNGVANVTIHPTFPRRIVLLELYGMVHPF